MSTSVELEPGASSESVLLADDTSDVLEHFEHMSSSLEEIKSLNSNKKSNDTTNSNSKSTNSIDNLDETNIENSSISHEEDDCTQSNEWITKNKHVFVLSPAGKPIYSRYGSEDKLAWLFGVMQTLVSFVQSNGDTIKSIHAGGTTFVFLQKKPLILVAVSRTAESVAQLTSQLNYVFNQIASVFTLTRLLSIYEQRQNYDLRRLLSGAERLIDHLLAFYEREPACTLGAIQCLPLAASARETITSAIVSSCAKIKNLVFAILLANNKLITLVRMKKYALHPADLHLVFNLVQASESLKTAESWTPLCLPRFDASGFLYGHVSYLAEDCQACLLLLTVEKEVFFELSEARQRIVERLRRGGCLEAINEALSAPEERFPEIRHYLYKCKSTAQFHQPAVAAPYSLRAAELMDLYKRAHQSLHGSATRPLKLFFERTTNEAVLAWDTRGFELYAVFEPLIDTNMAIALVGRLLNWIKKREDRIFHLSAPTF